MTTIAATLKEMAADSGVVTSGGVFPSHKLMRTRRGLAGAAGDAAHCIAVLEWLDGQRRKPRLSASADFACLLLNEEGLFYLEYDLTLNPVLDGIFAIGSGGAFALGSMQRDLMMSREPCPRSAVEIACQRDALTSGPVVVIGLKEPAA